MSVLDREWIGDFAQDLSDSFGRYCEDLGGRDMLGTRDAGDPVGTISTGSFVAPDRCVFIVKEGWASEITGSGEMTVPASYIGAHYRWLDADDTPTGADMLVAFVDEVQRRLHQLTALAAGRSDTLLWSKGGVTTRQWTEMDDQMYAGWNHVEACVEFGMALLIGPWNG